MEPALNDSQLMVLKMFSSLKTKEDSEELQSLLVAFLADKVDREISKVEAERGYTAEVYEKWKSEHFRRKSA